MNCRKLNGCEPCLSALQLSGSSVRASVTGVPRRRLAAPEKPPAAGACFPTPDPRSSICPAACRSWLVLSPVFGASEGGTGPLGPVPFPAPGLASAPLPPQTAPGTKAEQVSPRWARVPGGQLTAANGPRGRAEPRAQAFASLWGTEGTLG